MITVNFDGFVVPVTCTNDQSFSIGAENFDNPTTACCNDGFVTGPFTTFDNVLTKNGDDVKSSTISGVLQ